MTDDVKTRLFDEQFARLSQQKAVRTGIVLDQTPEPDTTAEGLKISQRVGLPLNVVMGSMDQFRTEAERKTLTDNLSSAPKLSDWLGQDPVNGALAKDDTEVLGWFETSASDPLVKDGRQQKLEESITTLTTELNDPQTTWQRKSELYGEIAGLNSKLGDVRLAISQLDDTEDSRAEMAKIDIFSEEALGDTAARRGQQAVTGATDVISALPEQLAIANASLESQGRQDVAEMAAPIAREMERYQAVLLDPATPEDERAGYQEHLLELATQYERMTGLSLDAVTPAKDRNVFALGQKIRDAVTSVVGAPDERDQSFWGKLSYGAGNAVGMAVSAVAGSVVAGPGGALIVGGAEGASLNSSAVYKEALASGATEEEARQAAGFAALIGVSEIIPIGRALKIFPDELRDRIGTAIAGKVGDILVSAGEESAQEMLSQIANNLLAQFSYDPERATSEGVGESGLIGAILGGGLGGAVTVGQSGGGDKEGLLSGMREAVAPAFDKITDIVTRLVRSGQSAAKLAEVDAMAAASKLKERSPEKFKDALDASGVGDANLYVSAEDLQTYYQSQGKEVDYAALGVTPETFKWKVESGGDVSIPASNYAASISGTDDAAWFRDNGVFGMDEAPEVDAAAVNERIQSVIEQTRQEYAAAENIERMARDVDARIYDKVFSDLRAAGRSPDVAGAEAAIMSAFYRTMPERANMDPEDMADMFGLRVEGPVGEAERRRSVLDASINTLRSQGDMALKPKGDSLSDFVKRRGGIADTGGDVASMDLPKGVIGSKRGEQRQGVLGLDDMGRAALEAGYFPELAGQTDADMQRALLDALAAESRGEKRYQPGQGVNESLASLQAELNRRGVDLALSNDDIMAALEGNGQSYDQFAGPQSKTADLHAMATAKDMLNSGSSAEYVREQTGWFQGVDGQWRYEISDADAKFKPGTVPRLGEGATSTDFLYLGDLLEHESLFAAYPTMRHINVIFDPTIDANGQAAWNGTFIKLNPAKLADRDAMMSTLLHEVQHVIQSREGYATGGNLEITDRIRDGVKRLMETKIQDVMRWTVKNSDTIEAAKAKQALAGYAGLYKSAEALMRYSNSDKPSGMFRLIRSEAGWLYADIIQNGDPELARRARDLDRTMWQLPKPHKMAQRNRFLSDYAFALSQILKDAIPADILQSFRTDPRQLNSMVAAYEKDANRARQKLKPLGRVKDEAQRARELAETTTYKTRFEIYRALAGEVEARNTQTRQAMTDAERRATPPGRTQDLNDGEVIVVFGNGEMSTPFIANMAEDTADTRPQQDDPLTAPGWGDVMLDVETENGDTAEISAADVEAAIAMREDDAKTLLRCLNG